MKDYLISLYIDNELDLGEKIDFVETVHADRGFTDEAVALLRQEERLRACPTVAPPLPAAPPVMRTESRPWASVFAFWLRPLAGFAAALLVVGLFTLLRPSPPQSLTHLKTPHRFVVYLPDSREANLVGTFTGWKPVAMQPVGDSGYWTLTLPVPQGEHRSSYLVGDGRQIADPTVPAREQDDFGGENSVIEVRVAI